MKWKMGSLLFRAVLVFSLFGAVQLFAFQLSEKSSSVSVEQSVDGRQTCETGGDARAQVDLKGSSVIRLGANSVLGSGASGALVELLGGTAVFDFGNEEQSLLLRHAGKQMTVNGGTGFARFARSDSGQEEVLLVGAIAGKVIVVREGKSRRLRPGELIAFDVQGKQICSYFDLVKLVDSATLLNEFQSLLPSREAIQREVKRFVSLQKRGFVRSGSGESTEQLLAGKVTLPTDVGTLTLAAPNLASISSLNSGSASVIVSSHQQDSCVMYRCLTPSSIEIRIFTIGSLPPLPPAPYNPLPPLPPAPYNPLPPLPPRPIVPGR